MKLQIRKSLNEARATIDSFDSLVTEFKEKFPEARDLNDNTIVNIINVYCKDLGINKNNVDIEAVIEWLKESGSFGRFILDFPNDLSMRAIADLGVHDPDFVDTIKNLGVKWKMIDNDWHDLTTHYDPDEKGSRKVLSPEEFIVSILKYLTVDPVREPGDMDKPSAELSDDVVFSQEKYDDLFKEIEDAYHPAATAFKEGADEPAEPVAEPVDPIESAPVEDKISPTIEKAAFSDMINSLIQNSWNTVSELNSAIATIDSEYNEGNKEDIKAILNAILDDVTIDTGMLYKAASLIDNKTNELTDAGVEKAENIINQ